MSGCGGFLHSTLGCLGRDKECSRVKATSATASTPEAYNVYFKSSFITGILNYRLYDLELSVFISDALQS